ncbi:MAG TPA: hypothetical protein VL361_08950 [Candidatus Limnocylindrales bacterium]|nr:hypothetical protein [Candidatus Limnocylindrales bacterium]
MKRLITLVALLSLMGVLAGCNQDTGSKTDTSTNAAPAAPSTNK